VSVEPRGGGGGMMMNERNKERSNDAAEGDSVNGSYCGEHQ